MKKIGIILAFLFIMTSLFSACNSSSVDNDNITTEYESLINNIDIDEYFVDAIQAISDGNYILANKNIQQSDNEENKKIIELIIIHIFIKESGNGSELMGAISNEGLELINSYLLPLANEKKLDTIDFLLDDELTEKAKELESYLKTQSTIPVEILPSDFSILYNTYFDALADSTFVFIDMFENFTDTTKTQMTEDRALSIADNLFTGSTEVRKLSYKYLKDDIPKEYIEMFELE